MKKLIPIIILLLLAAGAGYAAWRKYGAENAWVCDNGAWIKDGNPLSPAPSTSCPAVPADGVAKDKSDLIKVDSPQPGETVSNPLIISGQARGSWFFEASFPVRLLDDSGRELSAGAATAQSDWMTDGLVPFTAELAYSVPATTSAVLVLKKDNPSGLPANDDGVGIGLILPKTEDMVLLVYFNNSKNDPQMLDCGKTAPVERLVTKTEAVGKAALEELLKGPTEAEAKQGMFSSINSNVKLKSLVITDGVAKADFDERLGYQVAGSCRVTAIRAQIENTLKQFPTVKEVVISIEGRTEDILQP